MIRQAHRPILGLKSVQQNRRQIFALKSGVVGGLAALLSSGAGAAYALPLGPTVIAGSGGGATFDNSIANQLTVIQPSSRVVIDWNSFNIASGEKVIFSQEGGGAAGKSAIAFNVVTTPGQMTTIDGSLTANGGVWLFSPAGMVFGPSARVSTGSFLASTGVFNSSAVTQANNGADTIQIASAGTPAPDGAVSIDVQDGAQIGATAGFVLLHSPTLTIGNADINATDAVIYTADNDVQVQFATSASGVTMVDESSASGTPSDSHIDYAGATTAGSYVEFDAAEDVTTDPGYGGVINLSGTIAANGIKADTANPDSSGNGFSVILDGDSAGNDNGSEVTTLDGSAGGITAASGIYADAALVKTGLWTNNGGQVAISGGGIGGGVDVDQTLTSNSAGQVSIAGRDVAINNNVVAGGSMSIVSFATQVGPNVTVQAGAATPGSSLIVKATGDITADPTSNFIVGTSPSSLQGSLVIAAGATIGPQDSAILSQVYAGTGGSLILGAAGAGSVTLQATPVGGAGGAINLANLVDATGSVLMSAAQLNLGPNAGVGAGLINGNSAATGTISTGSAGGNVVLQNYATPAAVPAAAGDILLGAPVNVDTPFGSNFVINAWRAIDVTGQITESGLGEVDLLTDQGGGNGNDYSFTNGGALTFTGAPDSTEALYIDGQYYSLIFNQADLLNVNGNLGADYALAGPLDLDAANTGTVFTGAPIASTAYAPFTGTFTGLGNTISNLNIQEVTPIGQFAPAGDSTNGALGLFGFVGSGGVVRDVSLVNAQVSGGDGIWAGALVGDLEGTLMNASASGQVSVGSDTSTSTGADSGNPASAIAGGLVGYADGQIINAHSSAVVTGGDAVAGGLVGLIDLSGSIADSSASGSVTVGDNTTSTPFAGGLVGGAAGYYNSGPSISITGSSATGAVAGGADAFVGGFVGAATETAITGSFATGAVRGGAGSVAGGFAGEVDQATVTTSYAAGAVTQTLPGVDGDENIAGGFIGALTFGSSITQSYSTGAVQTVGGPDNSGYTLAGGFAGEISSNSAVSDAYSLGAVTSTTTVNADTGGFAGLVADSGSIDHVYATGAVSGAGPVAGLVAMLGDSNEGAPVSSLSDSYWDTGTTGQSVGYTITPAAMGYSPATATAVIGITGASVYTQGTYNNFDFTNTWVLVPGVTRPMLQSEYSTSITNAHQLQLMEMDPTADYTLANDIDASGTSAAAGTAGGLWNPATGFSPIGGNPVGGASEVVFSGTFDGQGHTISGLSINYTTSTPQAPAPGLSTDGAVGLFGIVGPTGVIENVNLVDADVVGGDGMLVGALVGGLFGTVNYASSSQSQLGTALVQVGDETASGVTANAGGLVGASAGLIENSHASVTVEGGDAFAGGLLGTGGGGGLVINSYATGAVSVTAYPADGVDRPAAGGLVGELSGTGGSSKVPVGVSAAYATGSVSGGAGSAIGGLVGSMDGVAITDAYATGDVTQTAGGANGANSAAGGFVGAMEDGAQINNAYASGAVNSQAASANNFTHAGGFAGEIEGDGTGVYSAYALGSVTISGSGAGLSPAGGFAGAIENDGEADHVYATGLVTGPGPLGGLAGQVGSDNNDVSTGGSIFDSYWDEGTTGLSTGAPVVGAGMQFENTAVGGATGPSPYATATYANFDLANDWFMVPGQTRPILRSEYSTSISNVHQLELMSLNLGADYTLAGDIDASETTNPSGVFNTVAGSGNSPTGFAPVGATAAAPFTGTFNGAGYTISNLSIADTTTAKQTVDGTSTNGAVGLFGFAGPTASISDVTLASGSVTGGAGMSAGLLVGSLSGTVTKASSSGVVAVGNGADPSGGFADAAAGGLAGSLTQTGSLNFSSSSASVSGGQASVGGLVGEMDGGSILTSFATGGVTGGAGGGAGTQLPAAGGLVGAALITDDVTPTITGSFATGDVNAGGSSDAGGFIGLSQGTITTSYATGTVTQAAATTSAPDLAGGFAGEISGGAVSQSFSAGAVTVSAPSAEAEVGGFVGEVANGGVITNAYSTSPTSVDGCMSNVGGFAGEILGASSATDFYATGQITTNANGAGLVGKLGGTLNYGYWDEDTTGRSDAVYTTAGGSANNLTGMGEEAADPFDPNTYQDFDFSSIWSTPSQGVYPQLYGVSHVLQVTATTAPNDTITYGEFPAYTVTANGLQGGDTFASAVQAYQVGPLLDPPDIANSGYYDVGSYGLSVSGVTATGPVPQSGPYQIIYNDTDNATNDGGTLTINQAALTISASPDSMVYDNSTEDTGPNSTPSVGGLVPGDTVYATQSYDGPDAGSHTLSVDEGYSVDDGNDGNNYTVDASGTADGTITAEPIFISATSDNRPYDGMTDSSQTPTVSGQFYNGDGIEGCLTQSFESKDVLGSGQSILVVNSGYTVNVADSADYNISVLNAAGTITPAPLLIDATSDSKVYDGTTSSTATPTVDPSTPVFGTDQVTDLTQAFASKDVVVDGCSTLVVTGYSVDDGNGGADYTVTTASAQGEITPASITLSAVTDTKTYDGTIDSDKIPVASQLFANDKVDATQSFTSKDVVVDGCSTLVVNPGYSIDDGDGGADYTITNVYPASGTINPAPLLIDATSDSKVYDGTTSSTATPTVDVSTPLFGTDKVTDLTQAFASKDVVVDGCSTLLVTGYNVDDGDGGADYTVTTASAAGTITPAPLLIDATSDSKVYDGTTSSTATPTVDPSTPVFGTDQVTDLTQAFASKDVVVDGCSTLVVTGYSVDDGNGGADYTVTTASAQGEITPASITLSAVTDTKTYDGTIDSDKIPVASQLFANDKVDATQSFTSKDVVVDGCSTLVVNPGYSIDDGDGGADYTITNVYPASGTITPFALTASLTGTVQKQYDGDTSATLTGGNYNPLAVIGEDEVTLDYATSGTYDNRNAGTGKTVSVTGLSLSGEDSEDYTVNSTASGPVGVVTQAPLTLTAVTETKTYDGTMVADVTPTNSALVAGDSISDATETFDSRNAGSRTLSVASYTIDDGDNGGNYDVTLVTAPGTINPAPLTLAAVTATKTYDGTTSSSGAPGETGLVSGDSITGLTQTYDSKDAGVRTLAVTGYTINDGNGGANYIVTTTIAPGTIDAKALTASLVGSVSKPYDGNTDATLADDNYSLSGVVSGDQVALNDPTDGTYDTSAAGTHKLVSVTGLAISGADAANYIVNGSAAAPIGTVTAPAQPIVYVVPPLDLTQTDLNEVAAATNGVANFSTTVVNVFPVGNVDNTTNYGDNTPITGAGNRDLWTGSDQSDSSCPPGTSGANCSSAAGNHP